MTSRHGKRRIKVELDIPEERVTDLLEGHGTQYSPWLHEMRGHWKNGTLRVRYDREEDEEGDGKGKARFTRDQVIAGIIKMAMESPYQFGEWLNENDDAITFDCALQYIVFGKLVYA